MFNVLLSCVLGVFLFVACGKSAGTLRGNIDNSEAPLTVVDPGPEQPEDPIVIKPPPKVFKAELEFMEGSGSYDFGTVLVGQASTHSFEIRNKGDGAATALNHVALNAPFEFAGGSFPGDGGDCQDVLDAADRCSLVVAYKPNGAGNSGGQIEIRFLDGKLEKKITKAVSGDSVTTSLVVVDSGPEYDFGVLEIDEKVPHLFMISNQGGVVATKLKVSGLAKPFVFAGGSYPGARGTCDKSIPVDGTCTVDVSFEPTDEGSANDTIVVEYNDGVQKRSITRSVTGFANPLPDVDDQHGIGTRPALPPNYIDFSWDSEGAIATDWKDFSYVALNIVGTDILSQVPQDMAQFCSNYSQLSTEGRRMFWISFVSALTKVESQYDPDSSEVVPGPLGNTIKRGLTRLDFDRARAHQCAVSSATQLNNSERNLNCAVKVLNYWVNEDGYISRNFAGTWIGASRIWKSLQSGPKLEEVKNITQSSAVCN